MRDLIAGNWKMNTRREDAAALAAGLAQKRAGESDAACDMLVCPPFPWLDAVGNALGRSGIHLGAQDCHADDFGAHTGDVNCAMLVDAGCSHVIVGHSERRSDHGESNENVMAKAAAAQAAGLIAIICIGETLSERELNKTLDVVSSQLSGSVPKGSTAENLVIAYEPVWAIGTGLTPTMDQVAEVHAHIRAALSDRVKDFDAVRILYGGSMNPGNAAELLSIDNVNGGLVGGASLKVNDFWSICSAAGAKK